MATTIITVFYCYHLLGEKRFGGGLCTIGAYCLVLVSVDIMIATKRCYRLPLLDFLFSTALLFIYTGGQHLSGRIPSNCSM